MVYILDLKKIGSLKTGLRPETMKAWANVPVPKANVKGKKK